MLVTNILKSKGDSVISVAPDDTIGQAVEVLCRHRIGAALVKDAKGDLVGILSERDIMRGVAAQAVNCLSLSVSELMTRALVSCRPGDSINDVMVLMTERRIRHLPVIEKEQLVGVISIGDVVKSRISEMELESDALRQYIATG